MTYQAFLQRLTETRDWYLERNEIRRKRYEIPDMDGVWDLDCPYLYACPGGTDVLTGGYPEINKGKIKAVEIWNAADAKGDYDPEIRRELLEACGLAHVEG